MANSLFPLIIRGHPQFIFTQAIPRKIHGCYAENPAALQSLLVYTHVKHFRP